MFPPQRFSSSCHPLLSFLSTPFIHFSHDIFSHHLISSLTCSFSSFCSSNLSLPFLLIFRHFFLFHFVFKQFLFPISDCLCHFSFITLLTGSILSFHSFFTPQLSPPLFHIHLSTCSHAGSTYTYSTLDLLSHMCFPVVTVDQEVEVHPVTDGLSVWTSTLPVSHCFLWQDTSATFPIVHKLSVLIHRLLWFYFYMIFSYCLNLFIVLSSILDLSYSSTSFSLIWHFTVIPSGLWHRLNINYCVCSKTKTLYQLIYKLYIYKNQTKKSKKFTFYNLSWREHNIGLPAPYLAQTHTQIHTHSVMSD